MRIKPVAIGTDQGNEDEDAPQAVNHAGNRRQQLDDIFEYGLQRRGQEVLGEENGHRHPQHPPDEQRQEGAVQGAPDLREDAELPFVGVPGLGGEKTQPVFAHSRQGLFADLEQNVEQQQDDRQSADPGGSFKGLIRKCFPSGGWSRHGIAFEDDSDKMSLGHGGYLYRACQNFC